MLPSNLQIVSKLFFLAIYQSYFLAIYSRLKVQLFTFFMYWENESLLGIFKVANPWLFS